MTRKTKNTKTNFTLNVTGIKNGKEETIKMAFANEDIAFAASMKFRQAGYRVSHMSATVRYCDADDALVSALTFFGA